MGQVDPDDDSIGRWVIRHYRFDPARREHRNVVVAAYDDESQFDAEFERHSSAVTAEIAAGDRPADEYVNGGWVGAGGSAAAARGRQVRRAIEHGANPARLIATGPLPRNMAVLGFPADETETAP